MQDNYRDFPVSRKFSALFGDASYLPSISNVVHTVFEFKGNLDLNLLERVIDQITRRHIILKSKLRQCDGGVIYVSGDDVKGFAFITEDLTSFAEGDCRKEAYAKITEAVWSRFDMETDPPVRVMVIKLSMDEHLIGIVINHFFSDAFSLGVFCSELKLLYDANTISQSPILPALPKQYNDYLKYVEKWLRSDLGLAGLEYFHSRLSLMQTPRIGGISNDEGKRLVLHAKLSPELSSELKVYCRKHRVTLFGLMLAINFWVLAEFSKREDLCFLVFDAGRTLPQLQGMIAPLFNQIPCCVKVDMPFKDLLQIVQQSWFESWKYAFLPFERLLPMVGQDGETLSLPLINFTPKPNAGPQLPINGDMARALQAATYIQRPEKHGAVEWSYEPIFGVRIQEGNQISMIMHSAHKERPTEAMSPYLDRMRTLCEHIAGGNIV